MQTMMIIFFALSLFLLMVAASVTPRRSTLSIYELERRRDSEDKSATDELRREMLIDDVVALIRIAESLLLVLVVATAVGVFGPIVGVIISISISIFYGRIARFDFVHHGAERLYDYIEPELIDFVDHKSWLMKFVRTAAAPRSETTINSRQELEHLVEASGPVLSSDEKKLIISGLNFREKTVESIMTPRSVVETIDKDEMIGPLTLDSLHRSGHSRFPVIDGDIDHVIGVLHIRKLLTLDDKTSETAGQAMEKKVYYINQDQTLDHALAAFLKTRHHLFVVVNGYRETSGILTLEDVIETLLGREIVDEFDLYDDLRAVAAQTASENNNTKHGANV